MKNLKDQLAGIAALIAAIVAIGGGFVKYGEITTKLSEIESNEYEYHIDGIILMPTISLYNISNTFPEQGDRFT